MRRRRLLTIATLMAGAANLAVVAALSQPDATALVGAGDSEAAPLAATRTTAPLPPVTGFTRIERPETAGSGVFAGTRSVSVRDSDTHADSRSPSPVIDAPSSTGPPYYVVRVITFYGNDDGRSRAGAVAGFFRSKGWHPVEARRASGYWVVEVGRYPSWDGAEHTRRQLRRVDHPQASFYSAVVLQRSERAAGAR